MSNEQTIEERTCRMEFNPGASHACMGPMVACSACGRAFPDIEKYEKCPMCEAKVIYDEIDGE